MITLITPSILLWCCLLILYELIVDIFFTSKALPFFITLFLAYDLWPGTSALIFHCRISSKAFEDPIDGLHQLADDLPILGKAIFKLIIFCRPTVKKIFARNPHRAALITKLRSSDICSSFYSCNISIFSISTFQLIISTIILNIYSCKFFNHALLLWSSLQLIMFINILSN